MTQTEFEQRYAAYLETAEAALARNAQIYLPDTSEVCRAARYSLLGGGKRIRAILVLAVCEMLGGDDTAAADFSAAVEMLHCYSLIHDDLPCMDNDDTRRGRPSCHKQFGEATALLAGDVLLTQAFEAAANAQAAQNAAEIRARAVAALSRGAGSRGMVYGQELDLKYEALSPDEAQLRTIHHYKTGALINAAVQMGAACAAANAETCALLEQYAFDLGLVFQIVDDVLDVTSSSAELGKPVGSDAENGKVTYATLYGAEGAMQLAETINCAACARMQQEFGEASGFLVLLAQRLLTRKK
ncbi:MAG: polyprenyl synthetase family protein [Faecalibacterium sp.]|jgi:geranylgeranyl pyrophosphate synthase|nr:polyprenyl synthetase family protein [Faecalibacterium sp.]